MALSISGTANSANNAVSITGVQNGDVVIFAAGGGLSGATSTTVSGGGLTWTKEASETDPAGTRVVELFWAVANATGTLAISASNVSIAYTGAAAISISGANTTTPFDTNVSLPATNNANATGTSTVSGVSTTNANTVLIGAGVASGSGPAVAGSGFTLVWGSSGGPIVAAEYEIVSSTQSSATVSLNLNATAAWGMLVVAVQAASGGGAATCSLSETFADFTLAAAAAPIVAVSLSETFSDFTLSSAAGPIVVASLSETFSDFTLSANVDVGNVAVCTLSETFADFTLSSNAKVVVAAALSESFADFTLAGAAGPLAAASLSETFTDFTLAATAFNGTATTVSLNETFGNFVITNGAIVLGEPSKFASGGGSIIQPPQNFWHQAYTQGFWNLGPVHVPNIPPTVGMVDRAGTGQIWYLMWDGEDHLLLTDELPPACQNVYVYQPWDGPFLGSTGWRMGVTTATLPHQLLPAGTPHLQVDFPDNQPGGWTSSAKPLTCPNFFAPLYWFTPHSTGWPAPQPGTVPGIPSTAPTPTGGGYSAFLSAFATNGPVLVSSTQVPISSSVPQPWHLTHGATP